MNAWFFDAVSGMSQALAVPPRVPKVIGSFGTTLARQITEVQRPYVFQMHPHQGEAVLSPLPLRTVIGLRST